MLIENKIRLAKSAKPACFPLSLVFAVTFVNKKSSQVHANT